jgi:hypothetical protein
MEAAFRVAQARYKDDRPREALTALANLHPETPDEQYWVNLAIAECRYAAGILERPCQEDSSPSTPDSEKSESPSSSTES